MIKIFNKIVNTKKRTELFLKNLISVKQTWSIKIY